MYFWFFCLKQNFYVIDSQNLTYVTSKNLTELQGKPLTGNQDILTLGFALLFVNYNKLTRPNIDTLCFFICEKRKSY